MVSREEGITSLVVTERTKSETRSFGGLNRDVMAF